MNSKVEVVCQRTWRNAIEICVFQTDRETTAIAEPLTFRRIEPVEMIGQPTMQIAHNVAQQLMDQLWICGLRPTEGTGSAGSLAATERHLADMQKIAFGVLKRHGV